MPKIEILDFVHKQIKDLKKEKKRSAQKYVTITSLLTTINLVTIAIAIVALTLLIKKHDLNLKSNFNLPIIFASLAAAITVIVFVLQVVINVYRGKTKQDNYKKALDEIQLEVIKFHKKSSEYNTKKAKKQLITNVTQIRDGVINYRRSQSIYRLFLKGVVEVSNH